VGVSGNKVEGNLIGLNAAGTAALPNDRYGVLIFAPSSNNTVGGTAAGAGNVIAGTAPGGSALPNAGSGIVLSGSGTTGNLVQGNTIGLNPAGTAAVPNAGDGIDINNGASDNTIGPGNVISGNGLNGVHIEGNASSDNVVQGCFIGTTANGLTSVGNAERGVFIDGAPNNTIGGLTITPGTGLGNVISGNGNSNPLFVGVLIANRGADGNLVEGNAIDVGADGETALPNADYGVRFGTTANNNTLGGTAAGAGNLIGANGGGNVVGHLDSVAVDNWNGTTFVGAPGVGNAIRHNSIAVNPAGDNGIYLSPSGGNDNQAAPLLTSAFTSTSKAFVSGSLTSAANTSFMLEFFASNSSSPPEGQTFLGQAMVTTDAAGQASFTAPGLLAAPAGELSVTATATNTSAGDTSAFSSAISAVVDTVPPTSSIAPLILGTNYAALNHLDRLGNHQAIPGAAQATTTVLQQTTMVAEELVTWPGPCRRRRLVCSRNSPWRI
jgi:hypothetical protein